MNTPRFKQTLIDTKNLKVAIKTHFKDEFTAIWHKS